MWSQRDKSYLDKEIIEGGLFASDICLAPDMFVWSIRVVRRDAHIDLSIDYSAQDCMILRFPLVHISKMDHKLEPLFTLPDFKLSDLSLLADNVIPDLQESKDPLHQRLVSAFKHMRFHLLG